MVQHVATVAFEGIEARAVDVQVQVAPGLPAFNVVGLADKAVSEARERVRSALVASGLALPARRITVNLAPADLPKEDWRKRAITMAWPCPTLDVRSTEFQGLFWPLSHEVTHRHPRSLIAART
jgi:hypothetical protein